MLGSAGEGVGSGVCPGLEGCTGDGDGIAAKPVGVGTAVIVGVETGWSRTVGEERGAGGSSVAVGVGNARVAALVHAVRAPAAKTVSMTDLGFMEDSPAKTGASRFDSSNWR